MSGFNWGDDSDKMKPTSVAGKTLGIAVGGILGAIAGGVLYLIGYVYMFKDSGIDPVCIPLFPILGFGGVGWVIGAFIGGFLGAAYDKVKDKQSGL